MQLEPLYLPAAAEQLDKLNGNAGDALWDAIIDTLELICENPESGIARVHRVLSQGGNAFWGVPVDCPDPDNYVVFWTDGHDDDGVAVAVIHYVGPLPNEMSLRR